MDRTTPPPDAVLGSQAPDALPLGRFRDWQTGEIGPRLRFGGETGVHIASAMGTGKDTRILQNALLQSTALSFFVLDPKAELAAVTSKFRRTVGDVIIINPYNLLVDERPDLKSDGYNSLRRLDPGLRTYSTDCGYKADAIIMAGQNDSGNSKHFITSANNGLSCATQWEGLIAAADNRAPLFSNVRRIISTASGYDYAEKRAYGWPKLAEKMMATDIAGLANLASQFTDWNNEISGVLSEARQQTKAFDDVEIADDLAKGTFDFADMKRRPVTVYCCMPPLQMRRQAAYLRLLVSDAVRALMRHRQEGEPKCVLVLNEMATLGHMDLLADIWGIVRGYGIQIVSVWQNDAQLQQAYGPAAAKTFISQAGVEIYLGAADMETAERIAKRCGNTTAVAASHNNSMSLGGKGGPSSGLSWGQVRVPTVTPHDVLALRDGQAIMFVNGVAGFISAYLPPYYRITQCKERASPNPYYRPQKGTLLIK